MTSNSQNDYYYNNENDALSYNSRPISSTIHRKSSSNKYECNKHESTYEYNYDIAGSNKMTIGSGDGKRTDDDTIYTTDVYDTTITASVGSSSSSYDYGSMRPPADILACTTNANMIYHSQQPYHQFDDVYSNKYDDNIAENIYDEEHSVDFKDINSGVVYDYWDNTVVSCNGSVEGRYSSMANAKILPKLPIKHSSSMMDGMYNNQQRYGASLPTTPPVAQTKSRKLPENGTGRGGGADRGYSLHRNHLYGNIYDVAAAGGGVGINAGIDKYLPTAPSRVLPQPQISTTALQPYQLLDDAEAASIRSTTTSANIDMNINSTHDNATINNYYNNYAAAGMYATASSTPTLTTHNFNTATIDRMQQHQRPHTSMAPIDYGYSHYSVNAYKSTDNLSTYSDTPVCTSTSTQQKLQQQRKQSIIMAMTTASVIASGETRITSQQQKEPMAVAIPATSNANNENVRSGTNFTESRAYSFEYDSNSEVVDSKRRESFRPDAHETLADYTFNTPASMLLTASPLEATSDITSTPTPAITTTRKLPKRLPTPLYKTTATTGVSAKLLTTSTSSKQLPKLPIQVKTNVTEAVPLEACSLYTVNKLTLTATPPSTETTTSTSISLSSSIDIDTKLDNKSLFTYDSFNTTFATSTTSLAPIVLSTVAASTTASYSSLGVHIPTTASVTNITSFSNFGDDDGKFEFVDNQIIDNNNDLSNNNNSIIVVGHVSLSTTNISHTSSYSTSSIINNQLSSNEVATELTTFDIADYLKPYTFPSYNVSNSNINSNTYDTSNESTSSLLYPTSTVATTYLTATTSPISCTAAVVTAVATTTTSIINNMFADDINSSYFSSDHTKFKDSNVNIQLSSNDSHSWAAIETETAATTTTASQSSKATVSPTTLHSSSISPLTSYLNASIVGVTSQTTISSATTTSSTSSLTAAGTVITGMDALSSSAYIQSQESLNLFHLKQSSTANEDYTATSNIPLSIITITPITTTIDTLSPPVPVIETCYSSHTTLVSSSSSLPSSTNTAPVVVDVTTTYDNYLKNLNIIDGEFPTYITDFLNCDDDYSSKYAIPLMDYKADVEKADECGITMGESKAELSLTTTATTTTADDMLYVNKYFIPTTEQPTQNIVTTITTSTIDNELLSYNSNLSCFTSDYPIIPPTTIVTSTAITSSSPITTAKSSSVVFDDCFYDSYNVDLSSLTAVTAVHIAENADIITCAPNVSDMQNYMNRSDQKLPDLDVNSKKGYSTTTPDYSFTLPTITTCSTNAQQEKQIDQKEKYHMDTSSAVKTSLSAAGGYYKPTATAASTSVSGSQKSASKTSSMIGDISKGIKGGLDGVLSGVGVIDSKQQQDSQPNKISSFGFGLAAKLVPNVGGLLAGSTASTTTGNKQQQPLQKQPPLYTTNNDSVINSTTITATTKELNHSDYDNLVTTNTTYPSSSIAAIDTPSNDYNAAYKLADVDDDTDVFMMNTTKGHQVNSQSDDILNTGFSIMYGDGGNIQHHSGIPVVVTTGTDYKYGNYDEYSGGGYSDYDYDVSIHSYSDADDQHQIQQESTEGTAGDIIVPPTTMGFDLPYHELQPTNLINKEKQIALSTVTSASEQPVPKKATSSFLSSLTNVASHVQVQPSSASTVSPAKSGVSSGMFGSFLGKAAAAVQSATQAVNQGASMAATAVVQKVPISVATTTAQQVAATTAVLHTTKPVTVATAATAGYNEMICNDYNNQLLMHQDSLSSQYSTTGDDYENSNMLVYTTTSPSSTIINNRVDKPHVNYYSNGNQSQSLQQQVTAKLLPTVPPAGSTGKKLPAINGKSGYLMKQQPTEIFDDEDDEDDDVEISNHEEFIVGNVPNYRIDSEQNDYYMDQQQTTPSSHGAGGDTSTTTLPANAYYEHTNGDYDYREDYFNEEDEYKYLEKEQEQQHAQELLYQRQKQQHQLLMHHQKQSASLDYIEEGHGEDYIDDNYPSEDSGNYLDESSSGSLGVGVSVVSNKSKQGLNDDGSIVIPQTISNIISTTTTGSVTRASLVSTITAVPPHQQIKKQDSIIMEEGEDDSISPDNIQTVISRKSSSIIDDDADQMTELHSVQVTQERKKNILMRGETEEVVGGQMMSMIRKPKVTAKQRWHWAYNKIIMQLNVSLK